MNYRRPELRDRLASEYVLGTLHGRARARFQQLLREDLELRDRVAFWERELTPMAAPMSGAVPSNKVWESIAARVAPRERATEAKRSWVAPWFTGWFDLRTLGSVAAGLFLGIAATMMAPSLVGSGAGGVTESQLPESYVGVLATADGRTGLIVSSLRQGKVMDVKRVQAVPVAGGQSLFLWVIEADGKTRAIGPVPQGPFVQVPLSQTSEALFSSAAELALSVEASGSTPAQPGGPFVYRGLCGKLWRVKAPS